jgi:hypothetical protein
MLGHADKQPLLDHRQIVRRCSRQSDPAGRNTMGTKQVILWPAEYKTGNIIYPYGEAKKK